jgi:hypothetical protein
VSAIGLELPLPGNFRIYMRSGLVIDMNETALAGFQEWWTRTTGGLTDSATFAFDDVTATIVRQQVVAVVVHGRKPMPGHQEMG